MRNPNSPNPPSARPGPQGIPFGPIAALDLDELVQMIGGAGQNFSKRLRNHNASLWLDGEPAVAASPRLGRAPKTIKELRVRWYQGLRLWGMPLGMPCEVLRRVWREG